MAPGKKIPARPKPKKVVEDDEEEEPIKPKKVAAKSSKVSKAPVVEEEDDEEEDEDEVDEIDEVDEDDEGEDDEEEEEGEEIEPPSKTSKKKAPTKKEAAAAAAADDDDDGEDEESDDFEATTYIIYTKPGTSVKEFEAFVKKLDALGEPDEDSRKIIYPNVSFQVYITTLDEDQLELALAEDIVNACVENVDMTLDSDNPKKTKVKGKESKASSSTQKPKTKTTSSSSATGPKKGETSTSKKKKGGAKQVEEGTTQEDSPDHLKLLSRPTDGDVDVDYIYNEEAGEGVYIYVLDTGVNVAHADFEDNPPAQALAEDCGPSNTDQWNHGTTILSVAGGSFSGAAKLAELIMVKVARDYIENPVIDGKPLLDRKGKPFKPKGADISLETVTSGFMYAINEIKAAVKRKERQIGQAVINLSQGFTSTQAAVAFGPVLQEMYANDIVFVTSAGNGRGAIVGPEELENDSLKSLGGPTTEMIVVGGVNKDGSQWDFAKTGEQVTVNALSVNIEAATSEDNTSYIHAHKGEPPVGEEDLSGLKGTSQAAGTVAGMVACLLSQPELEPMLRVKGEVAWRVKNYLIATAMTRELPEPAIPMIACNGQRFTEEERAARDTEFERLIKVKGEWSKRRNGWKRFFKK